MASNPSHPYGPATELRSIDTSGSYRKQEHDSDAESPFASPFATQGALEDQTETGSIATRQNSHGQKSLRNVASHGVHSLTSKLSRTGSRKRSVEPKKSLERQRTDHEKHDEENLAPIGEEEEEYSMDGEEDPSEDALPDLRNALGDLDYQNNTARGEDLTEEQRTRRRGYRHNVMRARRTVDNRYVRSLRDFYKKLTKKSLFVRMFVIWLPLALIFFIPLAVGAWGAPDAEIGKTRLMWIFIWVEVMWGSLWVSRLFSHVSPDIFAFICGIIHPPWRKFITIFQAMEHCITFLLWSFVSMITFIPIMTGNPEFKNSKSLTQPWQQVVQKILVSILICSIVIFFERLFIHFVSVSFHKTRFAAKIKKSKEQVRTVEQMLKASYMVFPPGCTEFEDEDEELASGSSIAAVLQKAGNKNVTGRLYKKNINKAFGAFNKVVGGASAAFANRSNKDALAHNIVVDAMSSKRLAEVLARRIWMSLVIEGTEALTMSDLVEVMGPQYENEAFKLFEVLDEDGNGDLSLEEIISSFRTICRERKTLYKSLKNVDSAIHSLHNVLLVIVMIIVIIIFIGFLAPSVSSVLATMGATLLAFSFVFSATAQEVLAACVFLFVKHPYDVGDLVIINAVPYVVVEVYLMHSVFRDIGSQAIVQSSNAVLNTLFITNFSRAGSMSIPVVLVLGLPETTLEDIEEFRRRIEGFVEENKRELSNWYYFACTNLPDVDRVEITINLPFKDNFSDPFYWGDKRTKLHQFIGKCINEIPLHVPRRDDTFNNPALPAYTASDDLASRGEGQRSLPMRQPMGLTDTRQTSPFNTPAPEPVTGVNNGLPGPGTYSSSAGAAAAVASGTNFRRSSFSSDRSHTSRTATGRRESVRRKN